MSIIEKYGLPVSPDKASLAKWDAVLASIVAKINAPEPQTTGEKLSTPDPLEKKYGNDEVGIREARRFVRFGSEEDQDTASILDLIVRYADDDPSRTYHLLNAVKDLVVTYLQTECAYFRKAETPKTVGVSEKSALRSEFNELRKVFNGLAAVVTALNPSDTLESVVVKNGKPEYHVSGFRGPNTATGEIHGKYARVYALSWIIDGEELPSGTPLADIVRCLWHGTDRVGKNSKDLADLLDEVAPAWKTTDMPDTSFRVNGHDVTITQSGPDDQ